MIALLLSLLAFCIAPAFAQTSSFSGTVTGIVTDGSGAAVPKATVTATNTATGLKTKSESNNDGLFTIPGIATGEYVVKIEVKGFASFEKSGSW